MKNFSGLTFTPPQTVRKLILTGYHSPLLYLYILNIKLSKLIFEFSDSFLMQYIRSGANNEGNKGIIHVDLFAAGS